MASVETIKEFLVSLGFKVDASSQNKFVSAIAGATAKVTAFAAAVETASIGVVAAVAKMSEQLEQLYYVSQRTGASVEGIKALGFAAGTLGSTAEEAQSALEALGQRMRAFPGFETFLQKQLGVATRGPGGSLRDFADVLQDIGDRLAHMDIARAKVFAEFLGIPERTLLALRSGEFAQRRREFEQMARAAGVDLQQAAKAAMLFDNSLRGVWGALDVLKAKVVERLGGGVSAQVDKFRRFLVGNFAQITEVIALVTKAILFLSDIVVSLAMRVGDAFADVLHWFRGLDEGTRDFILALGLIPAAAIIAANPIAALGLALLGLYDDYKAWKAGAEHVIPWEVWEPEIQKALAELDKLRKAFVDLLPQSLKDSWRDALNNLQHPESMFKQDIEDLQRIKDALEWVWQKVQTIGLWWNEHMPGWLGGGQKIEPPPGKTEPAAPGAPGSSWVPQWLRNLFGGGGEANAAPSKQAALPAEIRGLLETIAGPESGGDYGVRYGGAQGPQHFSDFSHHPNVWVPIPGDPKGLGSTAAGKYQFLYPTWETARKALNLPDFSPESQDRAAAWLAANEYMQRTGHDLQADLASGDPGTLANIQRVLSAHWGTLLRSDYMARLKANIDRARGTRLGFNLPSSLNMPGSFNVASLDAALQPMQTATLTPTINQNTTIHVTGTRDPHATAQLVAREQSRVNADLLRNMKSAFA